MENQQQIKTGTSFTLKKEERLSSKKVIDQLFAEGKSFLSFPVKVVFLPTPLNTNYPVQAGFSVSKKIFKRAVKRNRIKRLLREAYRLNKHILYNNLEDRQLAVFFIYIGKDLPAYSSIETAIKKALRQILKKSEES